MSFIAQVSETEAGRATAKAYEEVKKAFSRVPNFFTAQGARPDVIEAELELGRVVIQDAALPQTVKEKIALVVSGINHSSYCIAAHSEVLHNLGVPKALARQLSVDYPSAPASEAEQALFRFVDKLTRQPGDIGRSDVDALRRHGWNDGAIYETVLCAAWFAFINRISTGLGLVTDF
jgi:uncharacterized peroxidase-related enzyme